MQSFTARMPLLTATNPEQIKVEELKGYIRATCNIFVHDALDRGRCNPQALPSTNFADHTIDLPWRNLLSPEFGEQFQR